MSMTITQVHLPGGITVRKDVTGYDVFRDGTWLGWVGVEFQPKAMASSEPAHRDMVVRHARRALPLFAAQ